MAMNERQRLRALGLRMNGEPLPRARGTNPRAREADLGDGAVAKEAHSHAERQLLVVRAADPEAKALRAKVLRETAAERERKDTLLADKWVDENGGW